MKSNKHFYNYSLKDSDSNLNLNTKKNTRLDNIQYNKNSTKRKRFLKILLVDILLVSTGLIIFALFHHVIPRPDNTAPIALVQPQAIINEDETAAEISESEKPNIDSSLSAENLIIETEPMLNTVFADKFTDGEVITTDNSYKSKNINFRIEKVQKNNITYYVADIYLRNIANFQTAFAKDQYGKSISDSIQNIANNNNALLALTGDYYSMRSDGIVIRNSKLYRDVVWRDVLIMYSDGSMETFSKEEFNISEVIIKGAYQGWSFGPMLLDDGMPMTEFDSGVQVKNPRSSIGYYEPGHYCFVVVDGRGQSDSSGMTMQELSQLYFELGCQVAYNLDGGGSAKMMFMNEMINHPSSRSRKISDILMIVENGGQE